MNSRLIILFIFFPIILIGFYFFYLEESLHSNTVSTKNYFEMNERQKFLLFFCSHVGILIVLNIVSKSTTDIVVGKKMIKFQKTKSLFQFIFENLIINFVLIFLIQIFFKSDYSFYFIITVNFLNYIYVCFKSYFNYLFFIFYNPLLLGENFREKLIDVTNILPELKIRLHAESPFLFMRHGLFPVRFEKFVDTRLIGYRFESAFSCFVSSKIKLKLRHIDFQQLTFSDFKELLLILEIFQWCVEYSSHQSIFTVIYSTDNVPVTDPISSAVFDCFKEQFMTLLLNPLRPLIFKNIPYFKNFLETL